MEAIKEVPTPQRHTYPIRQYFAYHHLPECQQRVYKPIADVAEQMINELPDTPEKYQGLRKLLEAKDCFIRCKTFPQGITTCL